MHVHPRTAALRTNPRETPRRTPPPIAQDALNPTLAPDAANVRKVMMVRPTGRERAVDDEAIGCVGSGHVRHPTKWAFTTYKEHGHANVDHATRPEHYRQGGRGGPLH